MWDADTAYSMSLSRSPCSASYSTIVANNRFDKAVKTAIVASAAKLGGPAREPEPSVEPSKTSSASHHATGSASSHLPSASASKTHAVPVPAPSETKKIAVADNADGDAAASLAEECAEESASAAAAEPTPDKEPRSERVNSRFFRL